jgi:prolyl oligopeptidase
MERASAAAGPLPPPPATERRVVSEVVHGHRIDDPYRWLEDSDAAEVREWTRRQNAHTQSLLSRLPERGEIARRLAAHLARRSEAAVRRAGGRIFFTRREGDMPQPALWLAEADGSERLLVDPATAGSTTTALDWWYPSPDGRLVAYGLSDHGDEESTLYVRQTAAGGALLGEAIDRTRHCRVEWEPDGAAFYYTRRPRPGSVPPGEEHYHAHVYRHRLGDDPDRDPKVFGEGRPMTDMLEPVLSGDGRYLAVAAHRGWAKSDLYLLDRRRPDAPPLVLAEGEDALFLPQFAGPHLFVRSNWRAPRWRLWQVDPQRPERAAWRLVVAEDPEALLEDVAFDRGHLWVQRLRDAVSELEVLDREGRSLGRVAWPEPGTLTSLTADPEEPGAHVCLQSFTRPPRVYAVTAQDPAHPTPLGADDDAAPEVSVRRQCATSKDGTAVPMFVLDRPDGALTGDRFTLLTGYGGFNVPTTPTFRPQLAVWVEMGGVAAVANLRGGSEYGEDWHRAGMREHKQNVFDDLAACAEHLIATGVTRPERLAVSGRSNGGLLVGAAVTQRPDLFGAAECGVPLLDMVRFPDFLIAALWTTEYGDPKDADAFAWLYAYSPYHHVVPGRRYPAVLFHTAEQDSRVHPMHARKMAARMQAEAAGGPFLIRIEEEAGHGIGKPQAKVVAEQADILSFLRWQLGAAPGPA